VGLAGRGIRALLSNGTSVFELVAAPGPPGRIPIGHQVAFGGVMIAESLDQQIDLLLLKASFFRVLSAGLKTLRIRRARAGNARSAPTSEASGFFLGKGKG
jgi:hypothetical protein